MARTYAKVRIDIWADDDFRQLTELERDGLAHPTDSYGRTERGRRARKWQATRPRQDTIL